MRIKDIVENIPNTIMAGEAYLERKVSSGHCCDLLSWVMAHGSQNDIWITVQTHTNIIAVATLLDMACIIIPNNISVEESTIEKAEQEEIVLLSSPLSAYELAGKLYSMGIGVS